MTEAIAARPDHPRILDVFAVHSGAGGRTEDSRLGPAVLREAGLADWLAARGIEANWRDIDLGPGPADARKPAIGAVAEVCRRLAAAVAESVAGGRRFLALGGDHSNAIGTWSGAYSALRGRGALGLLWVDAHMDAHVPETSPSGNLHGMPVAHLLGEGAPELTALASPGPALRPGDAAIVGVRSFEPEEPVLLQRLGVRVFPMAEIAERGVGAVIGESLGRVKAETAGYGVSIDLDGLDPADAPGTGSAVEDGIRARDLAAALRGIGRSDPDFIGLEIAEFNPGLDRGGRTVETVRLLVESVFGVP